MADAPRFSQQSSTDDTARLRTLRFATADRQTARHPVPDGQERVSFARPRERSSARPLSRQYAPPPAMSLAPEIAPEREEEQWEPDGEVPRDLVPRLAAYQPARARRRPQVNTERLLRRVRNPWALTRLMLGMAALIAALITAHTAVGEPSQPLMNPFKTSAGSQAAAPIASLVRPETQGTRPDLYDSAAQFNAWWDAACSAAVSSEILTAWSLPGATIGRLIDVMQPDISLNGGLLRPEGFQRGAAAFGFRADINQSYSYKQLLYIANYLGLPVIINVRISYGYYHFFSGGHFLVVTGGDDQGVAIVDSSEYYIHYLPKDVFYSMFTGMTAVIVPKGYHYTVPAL